MGVGQACRAVAIWVLILVLAMGNGLLRQTLLVPWLGAVAGLLASGLLLCALILAMTWLLLPWLGVRGAGPLLGVGLGWLALTLGFEFSFGLLRGQSGQALLAAYTFRGGNLWPLVLVVTALAPWLAARLRRWV